MKATITSFIIFIFLSNSAIYSQSNTDINLAKTLLNPPAKITYPVTFGNESELKKGVKVMFTVYKKYISSQDVQACNFSPSCSVYALNAVENLGMLKGVLVTFDRLTRCHPLGAKHYTRDSETGLLSDPVPH